MEKSDLKILIVDDDPTLGAALEEALRRAGYGVRKVATYNEAKSVSKTMDFHGLVVDCMLPQKNGVDLVIELRAESEEDPVVLLTSGIYKDKVFSRDAINKSKAKAFLVKPFDIEEMIRIFDTEFAKYIGSTDGPISSLLCKADFSSLDRLRAIENSGSIHGFELPLVYSLLAKKGVRGDLEILDKNKTKSVVGFQDGKIDKVIHHDEESYFGVLLVEKGFTTLEAVEEGLLTSGDKPLGQKLVENSSVSPHVIEIIQLEQMNIRLSKTIRDTSLDISFIPAERDASVGIESPMFSKLLGDWISSKLPETWLKSYYLAWLDRSIIRGPDFAKLDLVMGHSVVRPLRSLLKRGEWPHDIQDLLELPGVTEHETLQAVHYLLLQRIFIFAPAQSEGPDWNKRRARLEKIDQSMQGQNHFEILGVSSNARTTEIQRSYQELAKALHPDRIQRNAPKNIVDLNHKVFARITEAYQTIGSEKKREAYLKTLEMGLAEEILKSESVYEQGYNLLNAGRYNEARKCFEKAIKMKGHRTDLMVYLIWAYIYDKRSNVPASELYEKVRSMIAQVPHEDRHSPHYFFIRGLSYSLSGEYEKAMSAYRHAINLDPHLMDARKEVGNVRKLASKAKVTLTDELSHVVTKFFGGGRKRSS